MQRAQDHIAALQEVDIPNVRMEAVQLTPVFDAMVAALPEA